MPRREFLGGNAYNNLEETVLKIFSEAGVTVDSIDVEACHPNQPTNP